MSGFTVRQHGPRAGTRGTTFELEVAKIDHSKAVIRQNGVIISEYSVDPVAGTLNIVHQQGQGASSTNPNYNPVQVGAATTASVPNVKAGKDLLSPNWRIEGNEFCIRPTKDSPASTEIRLPIADPANAEFIPTDGAYEIIGQPKMLFALALGIHKGKPSMLIGPTGIGKTTAYRWLCNKLNYNLIIMPISRGTEAAHLVGEYLPSPASESHFDWTDGPVTQAVLTSNAHPTLLLFDELNRIGNIAEFARMYQLLDDSKMLELKEKRNDQGKSEVLKPKDLFIGATANPTDDDGADYIGVQELDPALNSRFPFQPQLGYPLPETEATALVMRVPAIDIKTAVQMVAAAKRIREANNVRFPISFRELEAWALALPYFGYKDAAEIAVVMKAASVYRKDIRNLLSMQGA